MVKLPNVGREGHTYLHHIVNEYNNLADRTLFLQGNPYGRYVYSPLRRYKHISQSNCHNIIAKCTKTSFTYEDNSINIMPWELTPFSNMIYGNYGFIEFSEIFLMRKYPQDPSYYDPLLAPYEAEFAVDKEKILRHDALFYRRILSTLENIQPVEGHFVEKLWDVMFDK